MLNAITDEKDYGLVLMVTLFFFFSTYLYQALKYTQ